MPIVVVRTHIEAPVELCFDCARDISLHCETTAHTAERAVGGVTAGLIGPGETVTFEARHFGIRQRLTARITEFDRPIRFVDEMVHGAFARMTHVHEFQPNGDATIMVDTLDWLSPLGPLGILADRLFLERYMRNFLIRRNSGLKAYVERTLRQTVSTA